MDESSVKRDTLSIIIRKILSREEIILKLDQIAKGEGRPSSFSFINNFSYRIFRRNADILDIDYLSADGSLMAYLLTLASGRRIRRASFDNNSIGADVLDYAARHAVSVAIVGGTQEEVEAAARKLANNHLGLIVAAAVSGFNVDKEGLVQLLSERQARIAIFSMGTGLQERMALTCLKAVPGLWAAFTCGAFVSQVAASHGQTIYPKWVNACGLRWLYRLVQEKHVRKRLLWDYPLSLAEFLIDMNKRRPA